MALPPLATTADLTARGIAWTEPLATLYLGVASTAVRVAAGTAITETTSTADVWPSGGSEYLRLPGIPVTAVTSVILDGVTLVEGVDWRLRDGMPWRPFGWQSTLPLPGPATATWTHGLPDVPADLVDLVCRMTATALGLAAGDGSGLAVDDVQAESLGDYSVTYRADSGLTEMELSESIRCRLRARFGGGAAMVSTR